MAEEVPDSKRLEFIHNELKTIRQLLSEAVHAMREAETEVPEKMRRFTMYFHDVRDFIDMYRQIGQEAPRYILDEIERCHDRYRQLLDELHKDGGTFEKVRREMAEDANNRYDHTRRLPPPKGTK